MAVVAREGIPGHGSMPFGADNALVKAAEVVRRLSEFQSAPYISDLWREEVATLGLSAAQEAALLDADRIDQTLAELPIPVARACHAMTHTTFSPNVAHGGQKTNVIPDVVDVEVDIRTVPGTTRADVRAMLDEALGDLAPHVEITDLQNSDSSLSGTDNDLWPIIAKHTQLAYPGRALYPG